MISPSRLLVSLFSAACLASALLASPALGAAPAWQPVAASGPTNLPPVQSEVQRVNVNAEGGTFTLTFNSQTTAPIAFNAPPATVESALNALSSIGGAGGSASVEGGPGGFNAEHPYFVAFDGGSLANTNVAQMSASSSSLTGTTHSVSVITAVPGGPGTAMVAVYAQNVGGQASSGLITATVALPAGVTTSGTPAGQDLPTYWTCSPGAGQQSVTCTTTSAVQPGSPTEAINVPVVSSPSASGTHPVEVTVSGGGAGGPGTFSMPLSVSATPAEAGIQTFVAAAYDENGEVDHRAGGHPYSGSTAIFANTYRNFRGKVVPVGEFKNLEVDLPPGFLGNPIATPQCPENDLAKVFSFCSFDTIIGRAAPVIRSFGASGADVPVFNIEAPFGYPGKFFFKPLDLPVHAVGSLRSDEDYGLTVSSLNTAQIATIFGSFFTFWGSPADEAHDEQRCFEPHGCHNPSGASETAFLTSPTDCAREAFDPPIAWLRTTTWQEPTVTRKKGADIDAVTECENLEFKSGFTFQPKESTADSPGTFTANLTVPSEGLTTPDKLTTPEQKKVIVSLPKGVALNPAAAGGLEACSEAEIGLKGTNFPAPNHIRFTKDHAHCPDASKIGSVDVKSALLAETLHGAMYLAAQGSGNPFGSLFAVYLVVDSPERGILVKLPGEVQPDPNTGQLRAVFDDIPQLPFESLKLNFKGGSRSPMATPQACGKYVTTTLNTPWSAPESGPDYPTTDSFEINRGANGAPCASKLSDLPFNPGFKAGSTNPIAGAKSPFQIQVTRADGNQEIDRLDISPPPGFVASLKGIPYCSEAQIASISSKTGKAEQSNSSCPAASQVGTTNSGAGAGPNPFYAPGRLYLAGPYKGQTLSVVSVTPAVAGPFDLGNVVVRAALKLDPRTARITAISDPIPQIIKGVPLRARDIRIDLDRPNWAQNPTNCEAMQVDLTAYGSNGAIARPSNRYQVGDCEKLAFKPKLEIHLKGGTKRGDHPALLATLSERPGDANIARAAVTLPPSAFLDQGHIRTVCTRVQFAANACPTGAIYGTGKATTNLLDDPIEGNVYLRSSDNKLPDLVAALKGVANIEAVGRIDSVHGGIRNTFDIVPDAPFEAFTLKMQGGQKGLVVNSQNLCAKDHRATVKLTAQNGRHYNFRPVVIADGCKKARKHRGAKRGHKPHHG